MTSKTSPKLPKLATAATARKALRLGQFVPYYQPIVDLRTGQLAGLEVLARWQHPVHGLIPPDQFIPLAEKQGWIDALTQHILRSALTDADILPEPLTLSVNVSPVQLRSSQLPQLIRSAAEGSTFPLTRLVIEITESALIYNLHQANSIATELKAMGCRIALDDFGTGYSSLLHLQSLPFDELKIDRSFVNSMTEKRESRKIVAGIVGLGQSLGLKTVAEGIETREQAETMLWLGCDLGQGWYFGKPSPAEDLPALLATPRLNLSANGSGPLKEATLTNLVGPLSQGIAHLQAVYDGAPVGLCFLDTHLRHVSVNQRLADLNGISPQAHIGRTVEELVPPELYLFMEPYLRRALAGESIAGLEVTRPRTPLGTGNLTDLTYYQPARDEAGEVIGISVAIVDITDNKRSEQALHDVEERYRHTINLGPHIPWIMDAQGRNIESSPMWEHITGQTPRQSFNTGFHSVIHPDDLAAITRPMQHSLLTGDPIDVQYRVRTRNGEWLWLRSRGKARQDLNGRIIEWFGTAEDINELKKLQLANASRLPQLPPAKPTIQFPLSIVPSSAIASLVGPGWSDLSQIFETMSNGITISDATLPDLPLIYVNSAFERMTGYRLEEIRGFNCRFLQAGESGQPPLAALRQALTAKRSVKAILKNFKKDGTPFWNELSLSPIHDDAGTVTHYVGIQNDVTDRVELQEQLTHSASHDSLTGLANRRLLMDRLSQALSRAKRNGHMVAVLFLDLDNLKTVNDSYGHATGDLLLTIVGHRLSTLIRKHEIAARLGGDEFVAILEDIEDEQAAIKIRRRVAEAIQRPISVSGVALNPSASVGMSLYPADGQTPEQLLHIADQNMYLEKQSFKHTSNANLPTALLQ